MRYKDEDLTTAMNEVKDAYNSLWRLGEDLIKKYTTEIDSIVKPLKKADIEQMSTGQIRQTIFKLSTLSFDLGELRDKAVWTSDIADIIKDEAFAISYNTSEGAVAQRNNNATITISKESAVTSLYKVISSILKTRLDESHRLVDSLKSILISRASDQKLLNVNTITGEIYN